MDSDATFEINALRTEICHLKVTIQSLHSGMLTKDDIRSIVQQELKNVQCNCNCAPKEIKKEEDVREDGLLQYHVQGEGTENANSSLLSIPDPMDEILLSQAAIPNQSNDHSEQEAVVDVDVPSQSTRSRILAECGIMQSPPMNSTEAPSAERPTEISNPGKKRTVNLNPRVILKDIFSGTKLCSFGSPPRKLRILDIRPYARGKKGD